VDEPVPRQRSSSFGLLAPEGVIHSDIKPDNILFDYREGGNVFSFYVSEFGLSVTTESIRNSTAQAGTAPYMAPEVVLGGGTGYISDIWSFGLTLTRVRGYWCEAELSATGTE
jgi:serine/threonine protein kinase